MRSTLLSLHFRKEMAEGRERQSTLPKAAQRVTGQAGVRPSRRTLEPTFGSHGEQLVGVSWLCNATHGKIPLLVPQTTNPGPQARSRRQMLLIYPVTT